MVENPRPRMMESRDEIRARQGAQVAGQTYGQAAADALMKNLTDEDLASPAEVAEYARVAETVIAAEAVVRRMPSHWADAALGTFMAALKQRARLIPADIKDRVRAAE